MATKDYKNMKIIGIAGTNGSGKDTLGQIMTESGWLFVSVSDILRAECQKRELPIERENLRAISEEWRIKYGLGVLIDKAVKIFEKSDVKYKGLAVASLRNPGEANRVHHLGGKVVWLDADPHVRYKRIYSRARGAEDKKSFEKFLEEETIEMNSSGTETGLYTAALKKKADIFMENSGKDFEDFKKSAQKEIKRIAWD